MIRRIIGLLAATATVLALVSGPVRAGEDGDAQLVDIEKALWAAWAKGDAGPFERHLTEDTVNVTPGGIVIGKAQMMQDVGSGACKVNGYTFGDIKVVRPADGVAILVYSATQDVVCGDYTPPASIRATSVYVKKGGNWMAAAYTETPARD